MKTYLTRLAVTGALLAAIAISCLSAAAADGADDFRRISVADYRDKMAAGWIGQMVGVGWGAPTSPLDSRIWTNTTA